MKKIEKYIFIGCGVMIVILWILSSTDLILKEKKTEVHRIAVIADDSEEADWEYFLKGMEYAADQYHAEVRLLTMYDEVSQQKQNEIIEKEALGDAQILIVSPVNVEEFQQFLVENSLKEKSVITLNAEVQSDKIVSCIYADETEWARQLGDMIAEKAEGEKKAWIGVREEKWSGTQQFYDSLKETLEMHGIETVLQIWHDERELQEIFKREENLFVGLDKRTTELLAEKAENKKKENRKIFGNGINSSIVHSMENGIIEGIATINEMDMGCLAVANAVKLLEGNKITNLLIDQKTILSEEMYSKRYEQILFPVF
ncbi:MAG: substrate-binding domain-containing protein [Eubacteriales bacterium]|nr:substrate-binding domain-containing protein [Eubacteriales bacterium]